MLNSRDSFVFFFSSRRRHTRLQGDWSSDVCSSDLIPARKRSEVMNLIQTIEQEEIKRLGRTIPDFSPGDTVIVNVNVVEGERKRVQRSEERRVGKECRARWTA